MFTVVSRKVKVYVAMCNYWFSAFSGLLYSALGKYQILKLHYNIAYRDALTDYNGTLYRGNLVKKGISINYKIDDTDKTVFSLGYEHSKGGNPLKGLKDNTFGLLTIGAKVNL